MTVKELKAAVEYFNNFDPIKAAVEYFNNFDPIKYATNKDEAKNHRDVLLAHAQATLDAEGKDLLEIIKESSLCHLCLSNVSEAEQEIMNLVGRVLGWHAMERAKEIAERPGVEDEKRLREFLWLNHGKKCIPYGDDGEMQCCGMDFKRWPIKTLLDVIYQKRELAAQAIISRLEKGK